MIPFDRKLIPSYMTIFGAISLWIRWLNRLLITMPITIRLLAWTILLICTLCVDAKDVPSSDGSAYKIVRQRAIGAGVVEVEVNKNFPVPQEIRRHYQTKFYTSEYMLSRVNCSNRQLNVIAYRWYAQADHGGELVYSSDRETGWYAADKDPSSQQLVGKICDWWCFAIQLGNLILIWLGPSVLWDISH